MKEISPATEVNGPSGAASAGSAPQAGRMDRATWEAARQLLVGYAKTQIVCVGVRLGIADLLKDGPRTAENLSRATGMAAPLLGRVLRGLAVCGFVSACPDGSFRLAALGEAFRTDALLSLRRLAIRIEETFYPAWGHLWQALQTGETAFNLSFGRSYFEYLTDHPDEAREFNELMSGNSERDAAALIAAYDFSAARCIVDVGGGEGVLLAAILRAHPQAKGILFDVAAAVARAPERMNGLLTDNQCGIVAGDFRASVPEGGDLYMMKNILHNWDDARCVTILRNCRAGIAPHGRLLVVDHVVPGGAEIGLSDVSSDFQMLVMMGGAERTKSEFESLLEAGGFRLNAIIPVPAAHSILEAVPN